MRRAKIIFVAAAVLLAGCGGPKIIPDRELALIFHDIYLVNGYVNQSGLNVDSLNIYEPVLAKYGYTSEDVQYTIGNFAKRKSARLSTDVVDVAIEMLRGEVSRYNRQKELRDTIARIARLRYADTVYYEPRITVRRIADTSRLRVVVDDVKQGSYRVSWVYRVDSLDLNQAMRSDIWLVDTAGQRSGSLGQRLERQRRATGEANLTTTEAHRRLSILLSRYADDITTPHMTVDSLTVIHYPPDDDAVLRLSRSHYPPDNLGTFGNYETPFVAPLVDSARTGGR